MTDSGAVVNVAPGLSRLDSAQDAGLNNSGGPRLEQNRDFYILSLAFLLIRQRPSSFIHVAMFVLS